MAWSAFLLSNVEGSPLGESDLEVLSARSAKALMWRIHLLNIGRESSERGTRLRSWSVKRGHIAEPFHAIFEGDGLSDWLGDGPASTGPMPIVEGRREFVREDDALDGDDPLLYPNLLALLSTESDEHAAAQQARFATRYPEITVQKSALGDLARIGTGGQGVVWSVEGALQGLVSPEGFVYKEFRDVPDRPAIVEQSAKLIERLVTLTEQDQRLLRQHLVAPLRLVAVNEQLVGIVMRRIPDTFLFDLKLRAGKAERSLFELQHVMMPESKKPGYAIPGATAKDRLYLFLDLLRIVECLHRGGIVLGDINPRDVALRVLTPVSAATRRKFEPLLLGVDGFRVQGQVPRSPQMHSPNWLPPEVRAVASLRDELIAKGAPQIEVSRARAAANIETTKSDIYKLGLLLLRLFHVPSDPQHDDTQNIYRSEVAERNITRLVGRGRAEMLLSTLDEDPEARPTATQLLVAFTAG